MNFEDYFTRDEHCQMYSEVRQAVHGFYPEVLEKISHQMPAWRALPKDGGKIFLYCAAHQNWFGLYLKAPVMKALAEEIHRKGYETSGNAVHVPYDTSSEALTELSVSLVQYTLDFFHKEMDEKL